MDSPKCGGNGVEVCSAGFIIPGLGVSCFSSPFSSLFSYPFLCEGLRNGGKEGMEKVYWRFLEGRAIGNG